MEPFPHKSPALVRIGQVSDGNREWNELDDEDEFWSKIALIYSDQEEHTRALRAAIQKGYTKIVRYLVEECDVRAGSTELGYAICCNRLNIVRYLMEMGVKLRVASLNYAINHGYLDIVHHLVERGVRISTTVLNDAIRHGQLNIVRYLLKRNKGINKLSDERILTVAIESGKVEMVKLVMDYPHRIGITSDDLKNGLVEAAKRGQLTIVQLLTCCQNSGRSMALLSAARAGHLNVVDYLVCHCSDNHHEALVVAAEYGRLEVVEYLVDQGVLNLEEALLVAAKADQLDVTAYLVDQGALNLDDALVLAAGQKHNEIADYLQGEGATFYTDH